MLFRFLARTRPALDLTAMFNAFEPIFDLLQPADINQLATNIVEVLQGQGPTMAHLLDQTARLTSGIVDRDATLAKVVDNVTLVLDTTDEHRTEITRLVDGLASLTGGLAKDSDNFFCKRCPVHRDGEQERREDEEIGRAHV